MTNRSILHYAANLNIDNITQAQSAPKVASFTDRDNDWTAKDPFYADYGATGNLFSSNKTFQEIADNYVISAGSIWNSARNDGFIVEKNTDQLVEFNLRVYGSPGHWIPAPMLKGFCFTEYYSTALNSNWRARRLALEFKNYKTNASRYYAPNWDNDKQPTIKEQFRNMSGQDHWGVIRSWGPDWMLYGAVFNLRSNNTQAVQRPRMYLYNIRVAWQTPGLSGSTRWMPFKRENWNDFKNRMNAGTANFHHADP